MSQVNYVPFSLTKLREAQNLKKPSKYPFEFD